MKFQTILPACLLLLWMLTASVSCAEGSNTDPEIKVSEVSDGIELSCGDQYQIESKDGTRAAPFKLEYRDDNSGEYKCLNPDNDDAPLSKIFVKFRTCDNCIELDLASILGLAVGNVVATILIGVVVHRIMLHIQIDPNISQKKSSDRQHLVPNEMSNRAPNDHYQPLNLRSAQKDTYDELHKR